MKITKIFYDLLSNNAYDENQNLIANSNLPIFTYSINTQVELQLLASTRVDAETGLFDDFYLDLPSGVGSCCSIDNNFVKFVDYALYAGASGTVSYIDINTQTAPRKIGQLILTDSNNNTEVVYYNDYRVEADYTRFYTSDSNYVTAPVTLTGTYATDDKVSVTDYPLVKDSNGDTTESNDGKITYTLDLDNVVLFDVIINRKGLSDTYLEFQITDGTDKIIIQRFPVRVNGILDCFNSTDLIPVPVGDYYTKAEVDALVAQYNEFLELIDTPDDYTGKEHYMLVVNATGDGIEFVQSTGTDEFVKVSATSVNAKYLIDAVNSAYFEEDVVNDVVTIKPLSIGPDLLEDDIPFDKLNKSIDNETIIDDNDVFKVAKVSDDYIDNTLRDQILGEANIGDLSDVTTNNPIGDDILVFDGDLQEWVNVNKHSVIEDTLTKVDVENVLTGDITSHTHNFQLENGISDNVNDFDCSDVCKKLGVKFEFDASKLPTDCIALYHFNTCEKEDYSISNGTPVLGYVTDSNWEGVYNGSADSTYKVDGIFNTFLEMNIGSGVKISDSVLLDGADFSIDGYYQQTSHSRTIFNLMNGNLFAYTWLYDVGPQEDWNTHLKFELTFDDNSYMELDYIIYYDPDNEFKHLGIQIQDDYLYVLYDNKILDKVPLDGRHIKYETSSNELIIGERCNVDELIVCKTGRFTLDDTNMIYEIPPTEWYKVYYGVLDDSCGDSDGSLVPLTAGWDRFDKNSLGVMDLDRVSRSFTIAPIDTLTPFYYYNKNHTKIEISITKGIVIPDETGLYYVVFNSTGGLLIINGDDITMQDMRDYAFVASVIRFKDSDFIDYLPEQHSWDEHFTHHAQIHFTEGTRYSYGLAYSFDEANKSVFTNVSQGSIWDEDIKHSIDEVIEAPFAYRLGASGDWHLSNLTNEFGYVATGDTYCSWNYFNDATGEWELKEGQNDSDYWWIFTVAIPFQKGTSKIIRLLGQNSYASRNDAKAQCGVELRNLQSGALSGNEFIITEAYLIKRDGLIQEDVDGHYFTPIYAHNLYRNGSGGASSTESYYKLIVDMNNEPYPGEYTLPTGWNTGDIILIKAGDTVPLTVKPDSTERFVGGSYNGGYLPYGYGIQLVQANKLGTIEIEKGIGDSWKIRKWDGKWIIEGARIWLQMDEAPQYQESQNVWRTITKDALFKQNLSGDNALYVRFDSPYSGNANSVNGINYGMFENHCFYSDQYGYCQLPVSYGLNIMDNNDKNGLISIWVKREATSDSYDRVIIEQGDGHHNNSWKLYFNGTENITFSLYDSSGNSIFSIAGSTTVGVDSTWHKIDVVKKGSEVGLYLDGAREAYGALANVLTDNNGPIRVFHDLNGDYPYVGNAKDFYILGALPVTVDVSDANSIMPVYNQSPYWLMLETASN